MIIYFLQASNSQSPYVSILFLLGMFAVMYFFMIRPQVKKQKEQKTFEEGLSKGMQVVTSSGLYGKIDKIEDGKITIQADTKTYLTFAASAISKELTEQVLNPKKDK